MFFNYLVHIQKNLQFILTTSWLGIRIQWIQNQIAASVKITLGSVKGVLTSLDIKLHRNVELYNELNGIVELVGCYVHPVPVSSVLLSTKENEIYIVFYVAFQRIERIGCPSFVGHTSITLLILRDYFGRELSSYMHSFQELLLSFDKFLWLVTYYLSCSLLTLHVCVTLLIEPERSGL